MTTLSFDEMRAAEDERMERDKAAFPKWIVGERLQEHGYRGYWLQRRQSMWEYCPHYPETHPGRYVTFQYVPWLFVACDGVYEAIEYAKRNEGEIP